MEGRKGVKWPCLSNVLTIYGVSGDEISIELERAGESWRELERVGESWRELESLRNPYSNRGIGDVRVDGVLGQLLQHLLSVDANLLREITNSMDKAPRQAHTGKDCSQTTDCPSRQTAVGVAL